MSKDENNIAKFLRLQNGDDIISEVMEILEDDEHFYMLINPLKVVYMSAKTGYMSISFMPWVFPSISESQEFTVHYDDVLMLSDVSQKMNEYYWDSIDTYIKEASNEEQYEQPKEETNDVIEEIMEAIKHGRTYH